MAASRDVLRLCYPAAERNKSFILEVLKRFLGKQENEKNPKVLEIASGTGQQIVYYAEDLPYLTWIPSEADPSLMDSINSYVKESKLPNVTAPLEIDVCRDPRQWHPSALSGGLRAVLTVNLTHISEWSVTEGLFVGAGVLLESGGFLFIYGPFSESGVLRPETNVQFNQTLMFKNPLWGIRDVDDMRKLAHDNGLRLIEQVPMPSNNFTLVFVKD